MDYKALEDLIRKSQPVEKLAKAFSKRIGRKVRIEGDRIVIQELSDGYSANRRIAIAAIKFIDGKNNICLVEENYRLNNCGIYKIETDTQILEKLTEK